MALLWGLLGWKFTAVYVAVGMTAGVIGGFFMDSIRAERWLQPFIMEAMNSAPAPQYVSESGQARKLTIRQRHIFAYGETVSIFRRVWKWVIIGVGAGAGAARALCRKTGLRNTSAPVNGGRFPLPCWWAFPSIQM